MLVLLIALSYVGYQVLRIGRRSKHLPPGPPTVPIFGNMLEFRSKASHLLLHEWHAKYGPIFSYTIGRDVYIVLYDRHSIHGILVKKSAISSHRPIEYYTDLVTGGHNLSEMNPNETWRAQRKLATQSLAPSILDRDLVDIQDAEATQLLYDLLHTPDQFRSHVFRAATSIQSAVVYGHRAATHDDFWAKFIYDALSDMERTISLGSFIPVGLFPPLRYLPDALVPAKRRAKQCYKRVLRIFSEALDRVEDRRCVGDKRISIADSLLGGEVELDVEQSREQVANFLGSLPDAGTGTMILTHVLHLAMHPREQERAWEEIDKACGSRYYRMPNWSDFDALPCVNCIIKEGLRIRPFVPFNVNHRLSKPTTYGPYHLPANSILVLPIWGIHHAPENYTESWKYNPSRYVGQNKLAAAYAASPDYANRDHYTYGIGRRLCPGIHVAERTQWRVVAKLLWAFKIEPVGKEGCDLDAYEEGLVHCPKPFEVRFVLRDERRKELIEREYEGIREYLETWN
ncbi:cytochrome P450 oxidoreductase-like protein [Aaosphaeria arxii CBS 175.79]|uniref:Cytochrome P450 oxidoreductase-like protein n=1 Tax=Aaosphaeria arxii CBS 175.79 TaxID=1450172 RepID=A0A6A5XIE7_9PLEO|nr:cytochrome P450 oxidoreductase-like protein [Aaosphaeria arxii CBS 175.79]KAF2013045.1 cytochrome P450 oxidoreductase-like protein [Aaosphaeria arxii CBS 175.79]